MALLPTFVLAGIAVVLLAGFAVFAAISAHERERRATRIAALAALLAPMPFALALLLPSGARTVVATLAAALAVLVALALAVPTGVRLPLGGRPTNRFDERDVMFARARLRPGSTEYERYYADHPEHKLGDDRTRALPGLLSPTAELAEPLAFAAAEASFAVTEALRERVDGAPATNHVELAADAAAAAIKAQALRLGACAVGITAVQAYHVYSHVGRGEGVWGAPVELGHRWAVAFTVEMDHAAVACAPAAPTVAESARQYVTSAVIAVELAHFIRALGFPARAHVDGNYRVIAPLVARDAGLGEIGRIGLLMTPKLGPRVRLGVVTTDLPLVVDSPGDDMSVLAFCTICRKCAAACPTAALPRGERETIGDGRRWRVDPDACFRYWNVIGTDCGVCMKVCPYSHPDNPAHNLVRVLIRRSALARRLLLWADDLFYGR
jgi:ferredoxin